MKKMINRNISHLGAVGSLAAGRTGGGTDLTRLLRGRLVVLRPGQDVLDRLLVILELVSLHLVQLQVQQRLSSQGKND